MRNYETMFILRPELDDEKTAEAMEKYSNLIQTNGGEVLSIDKWGKRRLAYEINKIREGIYILCKFKANPELPLELERVFKISDEVIRFLVVRNDA